MNRRITSRAIIVHNGKLLCLKHKPYEGHTVDYWCTPGGGIDDHESLIDALKREIVEELGIEPIIGNLLFVQQFIHKNRGIEEIEFFFHVANATDYLNIDISKTSHGAKEIDQIAFLDPNGPEIIKPRFLEDISFEDGFSNKSTQYFNQM